MMAVHGHHDLHGRAELTFWLDSMCLPDCSVLNSRWELSKVIFHVVCVCVVAQCASVGFGVGFRIKSSILRGVCFQAHLAVG